LELRSPELTLGKLGLDPILGCGLGDVKHAEDVGPDCGVRWTIMDGDDDVDNNNDNEGDERDDEVVSRDLETSGIWGI
jgi:hypothetical protein